MTVLQKEMDHTASLRVPSDRPRCSPDLVGVGSATRPTKRIVDSMRKPAAVLRQAFAYTLGSVGVVGTVVSTGSVGTGVGLGTGVVSVGSVGLGATRAMILSRDLYREVAS